MNIFKYKYFLISLFVFGNFTFADAVKAEELTVNQLSDVKTTDWAFVTLQSITERYGCIKSYPDRTYRGNSTLTRHEFAAGLQSCLNKLDEMLGNGLSAKISHDDLSALQRLQAEFTSELGAITKKLDSLEQITDRLEAQKFSPITKLTGQVIFALTGGSFSGDRIIAPNGSEIARNQLNVTSLYRVALDFDTTFSGKDLLKIRLDTGANGGRSNVLGVLEPNFGSVLDISVKPPLINDFEVSRVFYNFQPLEDVSISIGPNIRTTDYIDRNSYANLSFRDFSTLALTNNFVLFPIIGPSAGAFVEWRPSKGNIALRGLYAAADPSNPSNQGFVIGLASFINLLYRDRNSTRGLLGGNFEGGIELEYNPANFALRFQYVGGNIFGNRFEGFGVNLEYAFTQQIALFGRYGFSSYSNTEFGNIQPNYWMAGLSFKDIFAQGSIAGIAIGQPFIVKEIGNATQTNFEAFYNFPFNKFIRITPTIQFVTNAGDRSENGSIVVGLLRTVFSF